MVTLPGPCAPASIRRIVRPPTSKIHTDTGSLDGVVNWIAVEPWNGFGAASSWMVPALTGGLTPVVVWLHRRSMGSAQTSFTGPESTRPPKRWK